MLNGNVAANRSAVSGSIDTGGDHRGATFWIRWNDVNVASSDDGPRLTTSRSRPGSPRSHPQQYV